MRELVDKQLMLEDAKSWVAMDSYDQHWINNMSAWIENLPTVGVSDGDCISRRLAIDAIGNLSDEIYRNVENGATFPPKAWFDGMAQAEYIVRNLPSVQSERIWHSCKTPPKHHKDVLVRGIEAIGNVTVYKVMQWDVDTWRPTNYAPSIMWKEWSEI